MVLLKLVICRKLGRVVLIFEISVIWLPAVLDNPRTVPADAYNVFVVVKL